MVAVESRRTGWSAGISEVSERLVNRAVVDDNQRALHRRMISVLLVAPFFLAAATLLTLAGSVGTALIISLLCAVMAGFWTLASLVGLTGRWQVAGVSALLIGGGAVAGLQLAGSGVSVPVALLTLALPLETYWITRERRHVAIAAGVGALALIATALGAGAVGGWTLWLLPAAYAASIWVRWSEPQKVVRKPDLDLQMLAELGDTTLLRIGRDGQVIEAASPDGGGILWPQRLHGLPLVECVNVQDRIALMCALADMREGAAARRIGLAFRVSAPGEPERFERFSASITAAPDDGAHVLVGLSSAAEIEALRADLNNARDRAASLEIAKTRFLGAVSHELRTPLNAIIGFSDMMLRNMAGELPAGRQRDYVQLIHESGGHLLSVVNSILDVSKVEAGVYPIHPEPFLMREAVELCDSIMRSAADAKRISFRSTVRQDTGEIVADRRAVQQIILNLVSNAIKFSGDRGAVSVDVARHGKWTDIVVADSGVGMSQDDLERIGEPFVQVCNDLDRRFEGAGLGLSLVKGLVKLHGGRFTVESAIGEGTTVRVSLPVDRRQTRDIDAAETVTALQAEEKDETEETGDVDETFRKHA